MGVSEAVTTSSSSECASRYSLVSILQGDLWGSSQKTYAEAAIRCPRQDVLGTSLAQSTSQRGQPLHALAKYFVCPPGGEVASRHTPRDDRPRPSEPHAEEKNKGGAQVRREMSIGVGATHRRTTVASPILRSGGRTLLLRILLGGSLLASSGAKAASKCPMMGCKADLC